SSLQPKQTSPAERMKMITARVQDNTRFKKAKEAEIVVLSDCFHSLYNGTKEKFFEVSERVRDQMTRMGYQKLSEIHNPKELSVLRAISLEKPAVCNVYSRFLSEKHI